MSSTQNLLETVVKLRERINRHREELSKSEALTRYVLIDPLLRALGWDTENPELVRPEDLQRGKARPDYVLYVNGKPLVAIEAKSLGSKLDEESTLGRCMKYSGKNKIPYFVITDGNVWDLYEIKGREGEYKVKHIVRVNISEEKTEDVVSKLNLLSYSNITQKKKTKVSREARGQTYPGEIDVNAARKFYESLTPEGKALLEIVYEAWKNKRVLSKKEIIEEMRRRGIDVDKLGFTGIKSGITRRAESMGLPSPLPTSMELGKEYWRNEASRYVLRDEWGRVLEKVLAVK